MSIKYINASHKVGMLVKLEAIMGTYIQQQMYTLAENTCVNG